MIDLSLRILDVLIDICVYLNNQNMLSPWEKDHIVEAINATINWKWFDAAINSSSLAITNPEEISPDNIYRKEIMDLSFDDHLALFKRNLEGR